MTWLSLSGDSTFWSWIITLMYILTAVMAFLYTRKIRTDKQGHFLWVCITAFLIVMGINKQLDIQILLTMTGKFFARDLGLMEYKNVIYSFVIAGLFIVFLSFIIVIIKKSGRAVLHSVPAVVGVLVLMLFVILRASGFSFVNIHGIELLGIAAIFLDLLSKHRTRRKNTVDN